MGRYLRRLLRLGPADFPSCVLWLEAEDCAGADGAAVAAWPNRVVGGATVTQATAGLKPLKKLGLMNGRDVLRFDGTDDRFATTLSAPQKRSVFVAYRNRSGTNGSFYGSDGADVNTTVQRNGEVFYDTATTSISLSSTLNAHKLYEEQFDYTGDTYEVRLDGVVVGSVAAAGASALSVRIGRGYATEFYNGDIAAFVMTSTNLAAMERENIRNYLREKYAVY